MNNSDTECLDVVLCAENHRFESRVVKRVCDGGESLSVSDCRRLPSQDLQEDSAFVSCTKIVFPCVRV